MSEISRRNTLVAMGAVAMGAMALAVALATTGSVGAVTAETRDGEAGASVVMAGFVNPKGKVMSKSGAGFKVQNSEEGMYRVTFDRGLDKIPVVVATATGEGGQIACVRLVNKNSIQVELANYKDFGKKNCGFHFIVVAGQ